MFSFYTYDVTTIEIIETAMFSNRNLTENDIAEWIVKIGCYCKENNINNIFISSLVCRAQFTLTKKIKAINNILENICGENGLGFIDIKNICDDDLFEDGVHLNESGKIKLANNFIYVLNRFVLWNKIFYSEFSTNKCFYKDICYNVNDESLTVLTSPNNEKDNRERKTCFNTDADHRLNKSHENLRHWLKGRHLLACTTLLFQQRIIKLNRKNNKVK